MFFPSGLFLLSDHSHAAMRDNCVTREKGRRWLMYGIPSRQAPAW